MRNDGAPGKLFVSFEIKALIATLLTLTLVVAIWNFQPYNANLLTSANTTIKSTISPATKLSNSKSTDPNKRIFTSYGNAASLFVQMGAYRGGTSSFATIALSSKPIQVYGKPWYNCEWISNNSSKPSMRAKATKMLPDWGYGRVYTTVVVNCTFPVNPNEDNSGGKLNIYAYYGKSTNKYEKIEALEEAPGSYNESNYKPPYKYEYLYCGSSLYGELSASRIREWMAYHAWFFGPSSHFVFHDAGGVSSDVRAVLQPWVRLGRVTIQDVRNQAEFDSYYYNQFAVVNDCLHRYRHVANWTFYFDVDEYIFMPDGRSLESVLAEFSNVTQFTIEQYPMSSKFCLNDSTQSYTSEWGFEKLVFRDSRMRIWRDRKYAIQAKNAFSTGIHLSENVTGITLHDTEGKIGYYHYHGSINVPGEPCRVFLPASTKTTGFFLEEKPFVYDDYMKNLSNTIKQFEEKTIGAIDVLNL
ncbi:hypothetical protein MKW98_004008 [Papaver atlanticum]|uniref:Glycosyltransferase family 92 protein n=1 Tax=Papaver atlanticum TaxID=357466 RepID=A0AAD4T173_9MAGN|nr:hypothetical protein MKW98_004008 [Papaver atlanticum]